MAYNKPLSFTQIMHLLAFNEQKGMINYSNIYKKYPRFGFKLATIKSLVRKGYLFVTREGQTPYRNSLKITAEGRMYLENDFKKMAHYRETSKIFAQRIRGGDVS